MPERKVQIRFEPEIETAATHIYNEVKAGSNNPRLHALHIADGIEQMLERYFPELATATSLDPEETVDRLLELYVAIHEDTANPID